MSETTYVFGYGSVVDPDRLRTFLGRSSFRPGHYHFCHVRGYRRTWNIAMDNRVDISGYKYYLDKGTTHRPSLFVTFLNVYASPESRIGGLLFAVSAPELRHLDNRERNYRRIDISHQMERPVEGRVWLYRGRPEAEARFRTGQRQGQVVIARAYYRQVHEAFRRFGDPALADYLASTDAPTVPLRDLTVRSVKC